MNLTPLMCAALRAVSKTRAATATEIRAAGATMRSLIDLGLIEADRCSKPTFYSITEAGRSALESMEPRAPSCPFEGAIARIHRLVSAYYSIPVIEMVSARRSREVARPRQVAMYLAKQTTPKSLPDIGRHFGWRDHTTVIHAVRKVEQLMFEDWRFKLEVETLKATILSTETSRTVETSRPDTSALILEDA